MDDNRNKHSTNGSVHAFPHMAIDGSAIRLEGGLSKRELIAAMCLQGLSANGYYLEQAVLAMEKGIKPRSLHTMAVESADSLLAELAKQGGSDG